MASRRCVTGPTDDGGRGWDRHDRGAAVVSAVRGTEGEGRGFRLPRAFRGVRRSRGRTSAGGLGLYQSVRNSTVSGPCRSALCATGGGVQCDVQVSLR